MYNILSNVIMFVVVFIFVFLLQYNFFMKPKIRKRKPKKGLKAKEEKKIIEIEYLSTRFNIDKKYLLNSIVGTEICLINSFIISFISTLITNIPLEYYFQLMIGFVLLMGLIYSLYELFGKHLAKKYGKKNEDA